MSPTRREPPAWPERADMRVINTDLRRVDGPQKVTGRAVYTHDVRLPGMVYARLYLHPYPRLAIGGVDVDPALEVPGVVAAKALKGEGDDVRYQGDDAVLAWVAAETPEAADDGLRAIAVEASELYPPVVTREQALDDDAPPLRDAGNVTGTRERGDRIEVEAALEACDVVVEATYTLPVQHHACLETHGHVVDYRGGGEATVYASTQMVTASAGMFAAANHLDLGAGNVRVITEHMGGGFGSKFGPGLEGRLACEIARELERPVHLMLTRPQEFLMAGNRSGSRQFMRAGATSDGTFKALWVEADRLGGMGGGSLPTPPYIYRVETSASSLRSVHTALDANRAMRAPGHPQASFAMEGMVDELAYGIGMDPLEFRLRNLGDDAWHRQLDRVAREIGWFLHRKKSEPGTVTGRVETGIGFGVSVWGSNSRAGCECEVRIEPDGSVTSSVGIQDLGTGCRTYVAAIVAEELGLELEQVTARIGDSQLPPGVPSGGSVTTGSLAPAVKDAAHNAREALETRLEPVLGAAVGGYTWRDGTVWVTGRVSERGEERVSWRAVCALLGGEPLVARGKWQAHLRSQGVHGAQAAKVSVDTLTGELKVLKMVCCQDQGIPMNRLALRSQINGGMIQALSYGLLEQRVHDPDLGIMLTANLEDYKIAGTLEMPEMVAVIDDGDERAATMGMAEAVVIPGHGAIANALFNACGVRIRELPLTVDKIVTALAEAR